MSKEKKRNSLPRRLMRMAKWLIPVAVIAVLVALAMKPKPIEIDAGTVVRGTMRMTVNDDGEARVRERYRISVPLAGHLRRINYELGDSVKQGDALVSIDPGVSSLLDPRVRAQAEAAVRSAEAGVSQAKTQLEARRVEAGQLKKAFERSQTLHQKGNVADMEFEQAESAYLTAKHAADAADAAVEMARFELDQAKAALLMFDGKPAVSDSGSFVIRSPIDGVLLGIQDKSARMVATGDPLLELGDPSALEMRIDVLSQDAVQIQPGQTVLVEHWGGAAPLVGRVRRVNPSAYTKVSALGVDEQRVDVIADFTVPPADGETLADGYRIEARIVIWEEPDAVQVPAGALFREGESWAAYKMEGDVAKLVLLKLGFNNGEYAQVLDGLSPDDRVILHPGDRIAEGTLVTPRK